MKGLMVLLLLVAVGLAAATPAFYHDGLRRTFYGVHAGYRNDFRQHAVNAEAVAVGAGVGTAHRDGVPGAGQGYLTAHNYYYGGFPYHAGYFPYQAYH